MMNSNLAKTEDGTITLTITVPKEEVKKAKDKIIAEFVKSAQVAGFRKGKAPKGIAEKNLDQSKVKEEVLKELLPQHYIKAVQEHKLQPIINPRIHVEKLDDDGDWQFQAVTCEIPQVTLGKYKDEVQKITAKSKIVVPGKEQQPPSFDEIMQAVIKNVDVKVPQVLVEQEVERLLSQTLEDIKKLGLTLDQYLASTGKNPESLRNEYATKAANDIKLEFAIQKIGEEQKITVEEKEIDEAIQKAKSEEERQALSTNRYLLASIIRQQKTLDFLKNL